MLYDATRVIDVVIAVITAQGDQMTSTTEETGSAQAAGTEKPKPGKKARVAPTRAHVALKKGKASKRASPAIVNLRMVGVENEKDMESYRGATSKPPALRTAADARRHRLGFLPALGAPHGRNS